MSWFPADADGKVAVRFSRNVLVKKGDLALFLSSHGKADGGLLTVEMVSETVNITAIKDGEGVVNVELPDLRFVGCGLFCLFFKNLHTEVSNKRGNWAPQEVRNLSRC